MELDNVIIPAINAHPNNKPLESHKILINQMVTYGDIVTEEKKINVMPLFS